VVFVKFVLKNTSFFLVDNLNDDIWNIKNVNLKVPLTTSTTTSQNQILTNKSRYNNNFFQKPSIVLVYFMSNVYFFKNFALDDSKVNINNNGDFIPSGTFIHF
jgi:hypothetical protein